MIGGGWGVADVQDTVASTAQYTIPIEICDIPQKISDTVAHEL